jgi:hypothetical protein
MTRHSLGFPPIRKRVWVRFYIHMSIIRINLVHSGFVGLGLILLNSDPILVIIKPKLK